MHDVTKSQVSWPAGDGEMARRIRAFDWAPTPLGPIEDWPQTLRAAADIMLVSPGPVSILWGPERIQLYNDAYVPIAAERHPAALGRAAAENWSEAYEDFLGPVFDRVFAGETVTVDEHAVPLRTAEGEFEDRFFTGSFLPVRDESGAVGGVFHPLSEVTARVRADAALRDRDRRLHRVLDGMAEGFGLLAPDFTILEHNREALRMDGRPRGSMVGRSHWDAFPGSEHSELGRALKQAMAGRKPVSLEHRYGWEDGRALWLEMRAYPTDDGALAVFWRDVTDRKTAEARLGESEEFNRRILEASADCIKVLGLDGRVEFMSAGGMCVMEVDDFAIIDGACWPDLWQGEERGKALAAVEEATRGGTGRFQGFATTMKGSPRWWDVVVTPINGADGNPEKLLSVSRDVTASKEAEDRLRESESRYRLLFDQAAAGFARTDVEGRFTAVNDRYCEITGRSRDELLALRMQDITCPEDLAANLPLFKAATGGGPAFEIEKRYLRPDGSAVWVRNSVSAVRDAHGEVEGILAVSVDITDRKRVEQALQESEARHRELNETLETQVAARSAERDRLWNLSQDMLARADYGGMMSAVSPAWRQVLGWDEAELLTRPYATFMHPDDMPPTLEAITRMAETRRPTRFENRIATRDGGWKPIEWTVAPEPDGVNFIAVGRDLSHVKAREAELEAAQEALRQSQKMEAMGSLTGGVAHDFNNLLTPIIGSLDMLVRKGVGSERERRLIDGALQSAERAKTLVQRLLAFARRQPLQPTAVDVAGLVEGMVGLIGSTLGPTIDVRVDLPPDLPPAQADPNQLEMALLNLAVNARDAMPHGGELTISASPEMVRQQHPPGVPSGDFVRLSVHDTGLGMDEATRRRAIEPFFSTKGVGKGTGLGLSMAHGLAAQLGGGLTIESAPGEGTSIDLWLPVSRAPADGQDRTLEPLPAAKGLGTALLVDDEELVRMSTADMLAELGYDVVEASSGEEALRLTRTGLEPDLLVTDHLMPGMSGAELARELRAGRPDLPVLIVSGYAEAEGVDPDLPRLTKPFRNAELAASLSALCS